MASFLNTIINDKLLENSSLAEQILASKEGPTPCIELLYNEKLYNVPNTMTRDGNMGRS
jgi:hypothetical protein